MGVSLSYWTTAAVDRDVRRSIEAETRAIARNWWCESINFFEWPGKPGLAGDTKLYFGGYSTEAGDYCEVELDDETFLAARDAQFIVDRLCAWSAAHGLVWELVLAGESIGRIANGAADARLREFMTELAEQSGVTGTPADDVRGDALLAKYAARL